MTDKNLLRSPESNSNEFFDRLAVAIAGELFSDRHDWGGEIDCDLVAHAVMEVITVHIPPILASAIQSYADSQIVALDYHGDGSAMEELRQLSREAAKIAHYATTHERWNGGKPA